MSDERNKVLSETATTPCRYPECMPAGTQCPHDRKDHCTRNNDKVDHFSAALHDLRQAAGQDGLTPKGCDRIADMLEAWEAGAQPSATSAPGELAEARDLANRETLNAAYWKSRAEKAERELAEAKKRADNLLASLPVWRCREGQNPELLYNSYWFLKRSAKLTKAAQVGGTIFGVGVKERLVIDRAQREHEYQQTPEREEKRIAKAKAAIETFSSAPPPVDKQDETEEERQAVIGQLHDLMAAWGNNQLYYESRAVVFRAWRFLTAEKKAAQSAMGEPVAWRYVEKETGIETLTAQPPDRVTRPEDYEITPLYVKHETP